MSGSSAQEYQCSACDWAGERAEVLVAVNMYDRSRFQTWCPECKSRSTVEPVTETEGE